MSLCVLEWGHRGWREYRDATWIRMDIVPSGTRFPGNDPSLGGSSGERRRLRARPPAPVSPSATGRQGRPVQGAKTGRGRHCRPAPTGTGGAVSICQWWYGSE